MPRIVPISIRKFIKYIESKGFIFSRISGSHHVYNKTGAKRPIIIPRHDKEIVPALIKSNLRTMGIDVSDYLEEIEDF